MVGRGMCPGRGARLLLATLLALAGATPDHRLTPTVTVSRCDSTIGIGPGSRDQPAGASLYVNNFNSALSSSLCRRTRSLLFIELFIAERPLVPASALALAGPLLTTSRVLDGDGDRANQGTLLGLM